MDIILPTFADFDNPRDHTAQYPLASMLFMALVATLSGATTSTEIASHVPAPHNFKPVLSTSRYMGAWPARCSSVVAAPPASQLGG